MDKLKSNPFFGTYIKKEQWSEKYKTCNLKNLWKYNLKRGWRLIYTVISNAEGKRIALIEWFDHKKYERRFGY